MKRSFGLLLVIAGVLLLASQATTPPASAHSGTPALANPVDTPQPWDSCGVNHLYYSSTWGYSGCN